MYERKLAPYFGAGPFGVSEPAFADPQLGLYVPQRARLSWYGTATLIYGMIDGNTDLSVAGGDVSHRGEPVNASMWWRGKRLALWNNRNREIELNGTSKEFLLRTADSLLNAQGGQSSSTMAASTLYYVYLNPDGILAASATSPVYVMEGVRVLGYGPVAREWLFIGYVRTDASTLFRDNAIDRLVANWFNRRAKSLRLADNTSHTYNANAWRQWRAVTTNQVSLIANGEDSITLIAIADGSNNLGPAGFQVGINEDAAVGRDSEGGADDIPVAGVGHENWTAMIRDTAEGYHFYALMQHGLGSGGTTTWSSGYIIGSVMV